MDAIGSGKHAFIREPQSVFDKFSTIVVRGDSLASIDVIVAVATNAIRRRRRESRVAIELVICDRLLAIESLAVKPKAATHVTPG